MGLWCLYGVYDHPEEGERGPNHLVTRLTGSPHVEHDVAWQVAHELA